MASTIRYDFSFPPKSNTLNKNQTKFFNPNNHLQNDLSLSKSTSTSILVNNNNYTSNCSNCKSHENAIYTNTTFNPQTSMINSVINNSATPKDHNCSFSK